MNQANEVFDVVDKTDRIVGQAERRYVHEHNLLHRAVHVFIQIRNGGWLLQKRSAKKDIDPLLWTTSCSGHVDSGEDYEDSAIRECKEELGLELRVADLEEVFRCSPCLETGHEFVRVYLLRCSDEFLPNDQEIMEHVPNDIPLLIVANKIDIGDSKYFFSICQILSKSELIKSKFSFLLANSLM